MDVRLLLINSPSPYFLYIPMGTFGLCDYLEKQKQPRINTRVINPSLYPETTIEETIIQHIASFSPTHIAIVFHWQETAHGAIQAIKTAAGSAPSLPIIVGGITAGFFAKELLLTHPEVSCVIKGDPEIPLLRFLAGDDIKTIPNLIWRDTTDAIESNPATWQIDATLLDQISFSTLNYLYDHDLYIEKTASILGFPLFIGRGCIFNCQYCGGGRHAFNLHSNRQKPAVRSIDRVISDLYLLREQTDTLYICYENDRKYILDLFARIAADAYLRKHFTLNYGAWHLIDDAFLDLYQQAFRLKGKKPVFEFSPEVIKDESRRKIKGKVSYPLKELIKNCAFLNKHLQGNLRQEIFFSRYHPTEPTIELLLEEIIEIFNLKHLFFLQENHSVNICYDHLSTDIAGVYWQQYLPETFNYQTFLKQKQQIDDGQLHPFPVDNLCFYIPEELEEQDCLAFETLVQVLNSIHAYCHELFHILSACLDGIWIAELFEYIKLKTIAVQVNVQHDMPFLMNLINEFVHTISLQNPLLHFLPDLAAFTTTKLQWQGSKKEHGKKLHPDQSYTLNKKRISTNQYNYLDLSTFIDSLQEQKNRISGYQRTVFLFLTDEILSLPHGSFRILLKPFETGKTIRQYLETDNSQQGASTQKLPGYMLEKLIKNEILIAEKNK